ncbi:PREDICTED: protein SON-like [Nicrophorus vespilloides]|uniref:Protein SON-like n=1 Tax=Nicrophorus vespilloides TaxID=110193 RepID=A0ABM1M498_NICVS|nr:PREDICTED: protein SON-like [Nicrophorus vespilloides]
MSEVLEVSRQIRQDVKEYNPDLTPTPEGQAFAVIQSSYDIVDSSEDFKNKELFNAEIDNYKTDKILLESIEQKSSRVKRELVCEEFEAQSIDEDSLNVDNAENIINEREIEESSIETDSLLDITDDSLSRQNQENKDVNRKNLVSTSIDGISSSQYDEHSVLDEDSLEIKEKHKIEMEKQVLKAADETYVTSRLDTVDKSLIIQQEKQDHESSEYMSSMRIDTKKSESTIASTDSIAILSDTDRHFSHIKSDYPKVATIDDDSIHAVSVEIAAGLKSESNVKCIDRTTVLSDTSKLKSSQTEVDFITKTDISKDHSKLPKDTTMIISVKDEKSPMYEKVITPEMIKPDELPISEVTPDLPKDKSPVISVKDEKSPVVEKAITPEIIKPEELPISEVTPELPKEKSPVVEKSITPEIIKPEELPISEVTSELPKEKSPVISLKDEESPVIEKLGTTEMIEPAKLSISEFIPEVPTEKSVEISQIDQCIKTDSIITKYADIDKSKSDVNVIDTKTRVLDAVEIDSQKKSSYTVTLSSDLSKVEDHLKSYDVTTTSRLETDIIDFETKQKDSTISEQGEMSSSRKTLYYEGTSRTKDISEVKRDSIESKETQIVKELSSETKYIPTDSLEGKVHSIQTKRVEFIEEPKIMKKSEDDKYLGMHTVAGVDVKLDNVQKLDVVHKAVVIKESCEHKVVFDDDIIEHEDYQSYMPRSDSEKFSETDAEPISSGTDSSLRLEIQSLSDRSTSQKAPVEASLYEVESPHSDDTEYTESHIESIIETQKEEKTDAEFKKTVKQYEIEHSDIIMDDDMIRITVPDNIIVDKDILSSDASDKLSSKSVARSRKQVKKYTDYGKTSKVFTSPRLRSMKLATDADVSSDDEKKDSVTKQVREKVYKKVASTSSVGTSSSAARSQIKTYIPKLVKSSTSKMSSSDSTSTEAKTVTKRYESKKKVKSFVTTPPPYKPPQVTRVYGYMQSTLSRDMKIERHVKESEAKKTQQFKPKSKKEIDNANQRTKQVSKITSTEKKRSYTPENVHKYTYERTTISSENKTLSRESTPVKKRGRSQEHKDSQKSLARSCSSDSSTRSVLKEEKRTRSAHTKETKSVKIKEEMQDSNRYQKADIPARIHSPKPSPSPTKLRRTIPIEEHIKKVSISEKSLMTPSQKPSEIEKTVQFTDRNRSQSVIPTVCRDKAQEIQLLERSITPTSLPGSPIRARSANGGTQVITSEVFTRSDDHSGSIEVIYRQPYENLKKFPSGIRNEAEISLIDTTDSSLSESIALPSSPSDHDMSSDANSRQKSSSPVSPKSARKSLESIKETYRVSDLITCAQASENLTFEEIQERFQLLEDDSVSLPRKLLMSQMGEFTTTSFDTKSQFTSKSFIESTTTHRAQTEDRLSPILDVQGSSPSSTRQTPGHTVSESSEEEMSSGNTRSVLPERSAVPTHSMAFPVPREVYK